MKHRDVISNTTSNIIYRENLREYINSLKCYQRQTLNEIHIQFQNISQREIEIEYFKKSILQMEQLKGTQVGQIRKKKRKTFTNEEDQKLIQLVQEYGMKNWDFISSKIKTRNARQCRERWKFYLNPNVNCSPWTISEDHILYEKYNMLGPKWSLICKCFCNRSINNVKNRWNSIMRKMKALNMNVNSEEDFYFCARLITKHPSSSQLDNDENNQVSIDTKSKDDQQYDPLYFYQISNLLNQLNEHV